MSCSDQFDPFQVFEVEHAVCMLFHVRVIQGRNITKGWLYDILDTPDPYILLRMKTAPDGTRTSSIIENEKNPKWNESFTFLLDSKKRNILEISLMEANYTIDQVVGTLYFNVNELTVNESEVKTFIFNEVSEIKIEMKIEIDSNPTLRYSLCLGDEEKRFIKARKAKILSAMKELLGDRGPEDIAHVPVIGVLGSGGGFRAMTGMSGAFKALADSGILDCIMYAATLSGSSWYLSTLYSHPDWPAMSPGNILPELRRNIDSSLLWLLKPQSVYRYLDNILHKRRRGQPVSFTDFYGHLVGETLLRDRLQVKLTDQQAKIEGGSVPLPLYTCVHVKKDVSARVFHEWVEFSPYEIGMPKYGAYMKSKLFGSKFFMGKLSNEFEEPPLHFLQGIWGSAFSILFKRLMNEKKYKSQEDDIIREEMHTELDASYNHESSDSSASEDDVDNDDEDYNLVRPAKRRRSSLPQNPDSTKYENKSIDIVGSAKQSNTSSNQANNNKRDRLGSTTPSKSNKIMSSIVFASTAIALPSHCTKDKNRSKETVPSKSQRRFQLSRQVSRQKTKDEGFWTSFLEGMFNSSSLPLLSTRAGRAGVVHNPLRGLSLQRAYPISPFTPVAQRSHNFGSPDEFDGIFDLYPTHIKKLYMVDAGLTFNSPYPLLLRPQRHVDIFLSFDFSARPTDDTQPFKELLLAEKWAKFNNVCFPPIDESEFNPGEMKELYVFRHPTNPHCPIVMHFVLANINFRKFKKPGVPRDTEEDKEFANFSIFDDPNTPYSTFNFKYPHLAFDRLSQLTEFNTLLSVPTIKEVISDVIQKKRIFPPKLLIDSGKVKLLRIKTPQHQKELKHYLKRLESIRSQKSSTDGDKPFSPMLPAGSHSSSSDESLYQSCPDEPFTNSFNDDVFESFGQ